MIELNRLGHDQGPFHLNPDLIVTVESNPDTTISLTTGTKVVVVQSVDEVVGEIRDWRAGILAGAYSRTTPSKPALVR
jgi:flagellar protein FlbD